MQEEQHKENDEKQVGAFAEEEANKKRQNREEAKRQISESVDQAKRLIINGQIEEANRLVYDKMTLTIKNQVFTDNSIELLPAYFVLAEANICLGGNRLKKAEEFLIAAFWNHLKFTSEENDKGSGTEDALVTPKEIKQYRACLHKSFGRLFLAQNKAETHEKAIDELSNGIYLECQEHGPESIYLSSSYYYMGELFKKEKDQNQKARSYFLKIVQIWKKFIMEKDLTMQNPMYSSIDEYYYHEALHHLNVIKTFFEQEYPDNLTTAEAYVAFGLVCLKTGDFSSCVEHLEKAKQIFETYPGESDFKVKEVQNLLRELEQILQQN